MNKKALIIGITGQDGSYLAELLLSKGYDVSGMVRRTSYGSGNLRNVSHLVDKINIEHGDLSDGSSLNRVISAVMPDEIYNLGAQADVRESFDVPEFSVDINGTAVVRLLESVKAINRNIKVYQASTSEMFGNTDSTPQNEDTRMNPASPYAWGKYVGFRAVKLYREAHGMFVTNGILFNHESPRRGDSYVTRKITKAAARIKLGKQDKLYLGNLDAKRDWGYAQEFMEAAWMMMQCDKSNDYVIGTGETHTVREWLEETFKLAGLDPYKYVVEDKVLYRPAEVNVLQADYTRAHGEFGFNPKVRFHQLIEMMYQEDLTREMQGK